MNNSYITIIKEKRTVLSRKRVPLNQNECTADFRIGVPFEQNLHSVENRYRSLCRSCLSEPEKDDFDSCSVSLQAPDSFDDTYYDVTAYINSYPSDSVQRKILSMYFYQDKSDAQIARKLKLSRQYVNRMKKKLILRYISENK